MSNNVQITGKMCYELHQELLSNGVKNTTKTDDLIAVIGGIDIILSHYLAASMTNKAKHSTLNNIQLQQIYEILSKCNKKLIVKELKEEHTNELIFHFNKDHTYLHLLFGVYANKIIHSFIYNKSFLYPMFIIANIGFLQFFHGYIPDFFILIPAFVMWGIVFPWLILLVLSVNTKAFKMIVKSFDFWIKMLYMLLYTVTRFVYIHYYATNISEGRRHILWFIYDTIYASVRIIVILIWSSLDALQLPLYIKIYLGLLISIIYSLNALFISLYAQSNGDDSIIHLTDSIAISLISYCESSIRIVAIFLWKQTLMSILKRNRCILIKYSPFIQWFDSTNIEIQMNNQMYNSDVNKNISDTIRKTVEMTSCKTDQMENASGSEIP
eukprot:464635_1